jgi:sugar phosphate isomerase/epimerase
MRERLQEYMRPSIVQFMIYPELIGGTGPIVDTLMTILRDPFFTAVEIGKINDPAVLSQVASLTRQARVEVFYCGQPWTLVPGLDLEAEEASARQQAIDAMKQAIDQAAALSSKTCGVMSGKITPGLDRKKAFGRLVDSLVLLCDYAAPKGIALAIENFDQVPYSKDCLIGPTAEAVALTRAVRSQTPNFGILLDLSHLPIMGETARSAVETGGEYITRVQIGNCSTDPYSAYYGDVHPYFGAPRTNVGIAELAEFLRALIDIGYLKQGGDPAVVSFEVKPGGSDNSLAIMAGCRRALEEAWAMV